MAINAKGLGVINNVLPEHSIFLLCQCSFCPFSCIDIRYVVSCPAIPDIVIAHIKPLAQGNHIAVVIIGHRVSRFQRIVVKHNAHSGGSSMPVRTVVPHILNPYAAVSRIVGEHLDVTGGHDPAIEVNLIPILIIGVNPKHIIITLQIQVIVTSGHPVLDCICDRGCSDEIAILINDHRAISAGIVFIQLRLLHHVLNASDVIAYM